jgi:hypothetical protein
MMCATDDGTVATFASTTPLSELEARVLGCLAGRLRQFSLHPHDGGLVLKGLSPTYHGKQLAQHFVMKATDLPIRANDIQVL